MGKWLGGVLLLCGCLASGMASAEESFLRIKGNGCCGGKGEAVLTRC